MNVPTHQTTQDWLTFTVGLPQYINNFVSNGFESLDLVLMIRNITDVHGIGVHKLGHKLKIWNEIIKLKKSPSTITPPRSQSVPNPMIQQQPMKTANHNIANIL